MEHEDKNVRQRLEGAYDTMVERVRVSLDQAGNGIDTVQKALASARDTAVELGELSRDEAERVAAWVRRDLHDAGDYLSRTGHELSDWLHMDLELIEHALLDLIGKAADRTQLDMLKFEEETLRAREYHTGEVTGPGTLRCRDCGEELNFQKPGHIPPCPHCHGTSFERKSR